VREKLNENPKAQVGLIALLVVVGAFMFMKMSSSGEEESAAAPTEATVAVAGTSAVGTATGATPGEAVESAVTSALESTGEAVSGTAALASVPAPPPPRPVAAAYDANKTVVLLIVHNGGIDEKLVKQATEQLASSPGVALFTVPAKQIARYAAITLGLQVNRVPALVVMRPKGLSKGTPQASVDYGFQTAQGVTQAVRDANYKGRELSYHPN
jgi:Tfp pilus assembly protein FimT